MSFASKLGLFIGKSAVSVARGASSAARGTKSMATEFIDSVEQGWKSQPAEKTAHNPHVYVITAKE